MPKIEGSGGGDGHVVNDNTLLERESESAAIFSQVSTLKEKSVFRVVVHLRLLYRFSM